MPESYSEHQQTLHTYINLEGPITVSFTQQLDTDPLAQEKFRQSLEDKLGPEDKFDPRDLIEELDGSPQSLALVSIPYETAQDAELIEHALRTSDAKIRRVDAIGRHNGVIQVVGFVNPDKVDIFLNKVYKGLFQAQMQGAKNAGPAYHQVFESSTELFGYNLDSLKPNTQDIWALAFGTQEYDPSKPVSLSAREQLTEHQINGIINRVERIRPGLLERVKVIRAPLESSRNYLYFKPLEDVFPRTLGSIEKSLRSSAEIGYHKIVVCSDSPDLAYKQDVQELSLVVDENIQ